MAIGSLNLVFITLTLWVKPKEHWICDDHCHPCMFANRACGEIRVQVKSNQQCRHCFSEKAFTSWITNSKGSRKVILITILGLLHHFIMRIPSSSSCFHEDTLSWVKCILKFRGVGLCYMLLWVLTSYGGSCVVRKGQLHTIPACHATQLWHGINAVFKRRYAITSINLEEIMASMSHTSLLPSRLLHIKSTLDLVTSSSLWNKNVLHSSLWQSRFTWYLA